MRKHLHKLAKITKKIIKSMPSCTATGSFMA